MSPLDGRWRQFRKLKNFTRNSPSSAQACSKDSCLQRDTSKLCLGLKSAAVCNYIVVAILGETKTWHYLMHEKLGKSWSLKSRNEKQISDKSMYIKAQLQFHKYERLELYTKSERLNCTIFFPGLFFYVYIESPNPINPESPTPQAPNPIN